MKKKVFTDSSLLKIFVVQQIGGNRKALKRVSLTIKLYIYEKIYRKL
jgi:hypothetical protein